MNTKALLLLLCSGLVLGACIPNTTSTAPDSTPSQEVVSDTTPDAPTPAQDQSTLSAYTQYSQAAVSQAAAEGTAVLFFHADWCPTCRVADTDLFENADQIPAGVTVLKTNYDTESDLKDKYNVVTQHTFVQLDANGDEVTKWFGGGVQDIADNLEV